MSSPQLHRSSLLSIKKSWDSYFTRLAFKNRAAEWTAIALFVSGLLLWDVLPVEWMIARWSLIIHIIVGILIFPLTTGVFWLSHRQLMLKSQKPRLRQTGRALDFILGGCFISGLVLTFLGDTGNLPASLTSDAHLISGLIMGPTMLIHAWRYSVLRFRH